MTHEPVEALQMPDQSDAPSPGAGSAAEVGVIGGSGFYALSDDLIDVVVDTPYGSTSAPISVGEVVFISSPSALQSL